MLLGIETEYGIHAPEVPDLDPVLASAMVVQNCPVASTRRSEPYDCMLVNGARFYVDHAHPEYAGPEVTNATDAVAHDLAGDRIVAAAAQQASRELGVDLRIYKNNTDSKGASYGCHENYLLQRSTPWRDIVAGFTGFLVSRSVVCGAGRVGLGRHGERPGFQLTQRADFFERREGIETTRHRPLINTRDEPHADAERWRRLHVITGDANRSAWSTWLKVGSAAAVLTCLERGTLPVFSLADPVVAFQQVSHDLTLAAVLPLRDGGTMTALDLQDAYCEAALADQERHGGDAVVLQAWREVLTQLRDDPWQCADRLDWVARYALVSAYAERHRVGWDSPRLAALDLAWAELDARSPFSALQRAGRFRPFPGQLPADAETRGPSDTRAGLRGRLIAHYGEAVEAADWEWLVIRDGAGRRHRVDLADPFGHGRLTPSKEDAWPTRCSAGNPLPSVASRRST